MLANHSNNAYSAVPIIRSSERRTVAGWMLSASVWFSIASLVLLWMAAMGLLVEVNPFLVSILGLGILFMFYVAAFPRLMNLTLRGRKMRAPRALDILSIGDEAPVVLLRFFDDDDLIDPSFSTTTQIIPGRYEERLVKALRLIGPAVALGRPGEPEPALGAARLYVANEHWQEAIKYLLKEAAAVVAIVGKSQGFWWEIEIALSLVPPEKLLFFFPYPAAKKVRESYLRAIFLENPVLEKWLRHSTASQMEAEREQRYQSFRIRFGPIFKAPLPITLDRSRFLCLKGDGKPYLLEPLEPRFLARLATANFSPRLDIPFSRELQPVGTV